MTNFLRSDGGSAFYSGFEQGNGLLETSKFAWMFDFAESGVELV
jgi:hypothetical protein